MVSVKTNQIKQVTSHKMNPWGIPVKYVADKTGYKLNPWGTPVKYVADKQAVWSQIKV